jgi:hypothetical protein
MPLLLLATVSHPLLLHIAPSTALLLATVPHPLLLHIAPSTALLLVVLLLLPMCLPGRQCQLLLLLPAARPYALCGVGLLHPVWHCLLRTLRPLLVKLVCRGGVNACRGKQGGTGASAGEGWCNENQCECC